MFIIFILSGICRLSFIKAEVCLAVIFGTTFIMPALSLLVLKKIKAIETFTMEKREERESYCNYESCEEGFGN